QRRRPVSQFNCTFTITDHEHSDCARQGQRFWIISVGAQRQMKKPNCFLAVELRIDRKTPKDVSHVTLACQCRAITNNHLNRERAVIISSTVPSAKYSCSGSPDMFWNGRTASDGLSGKAGVLVGSPGDMVGVPSTMPSRTRYVRTGRAMFLRACSPRSSNAKSSLSPMWSRTV